MCDNAKDKKSNEKNIVFFFGAGCEGKDQFDLPSGADFKRKTILAKDAKALYDFLNDNSDFSPKNGCLLHHNASGTLYQTLVEDSEFKLKYDEFSEKNKDKESSIKGYLEYKKGKDTKNNEKGHNVIEKYKQDFNDVFKEEFYDKITGNEEIAEGSCCAEFLEKACFYSYVDSLFNFIRRPQEYVNETRRVMKFYYAAFLCIFENLIKQCDDKDIKDYFEKGSVAKNREHLIKYLQELQASLGEKNKKRSYYQKIKDLNEKRIEISVITTNYTNFAEKILELPEDNISYLHGRLEWFENLETKSVKNVDEHDENAVIFPFIFAQSAVKPIVSPRQIKEYYKANEFLEQATEIVVLGYSFNTDDEHIVNMFREYGDKNITFFYHVDKNNTKESYEKKIYKLFGMNNRIKMVDDILFDNIMKKIIARII